MTRPHPVVGVAAELADRRRGRTDQADIREDLDHEGEILVAPEEGLDLDIHAGILPGKAFRNGLHLCGDQLFPLPAPGDVGHGSQHVRRHVDDPADKAHLKPRSRQLLGARHGPETVLEVVMLHGRERLDRPVAAVVVGEQQPVGRDDLPRASAAENDDGVLERRVVHAVNLLGREFAPAGLHILAVHFPEIGQHPHAFVRRRRERDARRGEQ